MSKLARALTLVATLAVMNLAAMTAIAHAATDQPSGQADAIVQRLLARERPSVPDPAHPRLLLDQERYYSNWDYGDTSAPVPPEPSGQPGWLTPALAVLSAVLALVAGVAVVAARRAHQSQRAGQTA
jgi:hypothetical protein